MYKPDGSGTLKSNPAAITIKGPQMIYCRFSGNGDYYTETSGCVQSIRNSEYSTGDVYVVGHVQGDEATGTIALVYSPW